MSKEVRIRKNNVDLSIHFDSPEELEKKLEDYDKIWKIVENKIGKEIKPQLKVREELKGIYEIQDNLIILLKPPKSPLHKVILTIYCYGPSGSTNEEISATTGITKPSRQVMTPAKNKKYFRKLNESRWYLSSDGLSYTSKLVQKLKMEGKNGS